jgi:hypothetical protein
MDCPQCKFVAKNQRGLSVHMRMHVSKPINCHCGKGFISQERYEAHKCGNQIALGKKYYIEEIYLANAWESMRQEEAAANACYVFTTVSVFILLAFLQI